MHIPTSGNRSHSLKKLHGHVFCFCFFCFFYQCRHSPRVSTAPDVSGTGKAVDRFSLRRTLNSAVRKQTINKSTFSLAHCETLLGTE